MKTQILTKSLATGLLVVLVVARVYAAQTDTVTAKFQFAFAVEGLSLPAGDYTFLEAANGTMRIHSNKAWVATFWTSPGDASRIGGKSQLVFHRYGDQYFLSQVFNGTKGAGRLLPMSKLEKDYIGASHLTAEDKRRFEVVVVAAR
jgi:hypothetical protein